jgi:hypothetical protein
MQFVLFGLMVILLSLTGCSKQPERETFAVVVSITPRVSRWHTNEILVIARSPNGEIGAKSVLKSRLACRVGDTVRASARGIALTLNEQACVR